MGLREQDKQNIKSNFKDNATRNIKDFEINNMPRL